jgi:MFS-type transporter involved in bile tolerance (Atg22 family)|tara:strand:- start:98 stop:319 length:222 start_codon:yes stop_codon:yes gene_type:complete
VKQLVNKEKKKMRSTIIILASIWFVVTLPLPWLVYSPEISQQQLFTLLPIIGFISIPFVALGIVWTLKPELTT